MLASAARHACGTQVEVTARMGVTQGVSAIEHASAGAAELRALAAGAETLGRRLEIITDVGDEWLPQVIAAARQACTGKPVRDDCARFHLTGHSPK